MSGQETQEDAKGAPTSALGVCWGHTHSEELLQTDPSEGEGGGSEAGGGAV